MKECNECYFPQIFIKHVGIVSDIKENTKKEAFWNVGGIRKIFILGRIDYFLFINYYRKNPKKKIKLNIKEQEIIKKLFDLPFPLIEEINRFI